LHRHHPPTPHNKPNYSGILGHIAYTINLFSYWTAFGLTTKWTQCRLHQFLLENICFLHECCGGFTSLPHARVWPSLSKHTARLYTIL